MHEVKNINLVVVSIEIDIANNSWGKLNEIYNEVKKQCPNGDPFIGRLIDGRGANLGMEIINYPFRPMRKYYEKYIEVQKSIEKRKKKG